MSSWGSSRTDGAASLTEVSSTRVSESLRSKVPVPSGHEFPKLVAVPELSNLRSHRIIFSQID